jgi:hypothetical protein
MASSVTSPHQCSSDPVALWLNPACSQLQLLVQWKCPIAPRTRWRSTISGFDRISHDPDILGGKACIREMRISVSLIVDLVTNRMSAEEIIDE